MDSIKRELRLSLNAMSAENEKEISALTDNVCITEYEACTRERGGLKIWTDAFNRALSEHEVVTVPLDKSIDELPHCMNSDPVCGVIAGFEFGAEHEKTAVKTAVFNVKSKKPRKDRRQSQISYLHKQVGYLLLAL